MDWIFLDKNFQTTDDFEYAEYIFIPSKSWDSFLEEYSGIYNTECLCSDTWFLWNEDTFQWIEIQSYDDDLLTKLNTIKEKLEKEPTQSAQKDNAELPESFCNKTKQIYKVVIEDMQGSTIYLDCATDNITDALHTIATAAEPNIFGKRAKKFTIEVIRE